MPPVIFKLLIEKNCYPGATVDDITSLYRQTHISTRLLWNVFELNSGFIVEIDQKMIKVNSPQKLNDLHWNDDWN